MNILITGGTGLIGKQLLPQLSEYSLTVLTRDVNKAKQSCNADVNWVESIDDLDFNQIDVVINLAGEPIFDKRWTAKQKACLYESRVNLTQNIAHKIAQANNPPHTFISGSAVGFYGHQNEQIDETKEVSSSEFSHQLCQAWEQVALAVQDKTRVCLLRTGIVLANQGGALAKMRLPFKLGLGGVIGSGKQGMPWIHIDDMVQIILFSLNNDQLKGAINACAPKPVSNKEFTHTLAQSYGRWAILPTPSFLLCLMLGERADLLLHGQFTIPKKLQDHGFEFQYRDLKSALNALHSN